MSHAFSVCEERSYTQGCLVTALLLKWWFIYTHIYAMFHSSSVNVYACFGQSSVRNTVTKLGNMVSVQRTKGKMKVYLLEAKKRV